MIIQCERCQTRFRVDDQLLDRPRLRLRCSSCGHVFTIERPMPVEAPLTLQPDQVISHGRLITFCNQKGGVAKTTSCYNVGMALARNNARVLLVDFDPQANLSTLAGQSTGVGSLYEVVTGGKKLTDVVKLVQPGLTLLPSNNNMHLLPKRYMQAKDHEQLLLKTLEKVRDQFDYILIDTPPSLKFFTLNALVAADFVVIPTQCAYLSMNGVGQITQVIETIRKRHHRPLDQRLLITLYDPESTAAKVVYSMLSQRYAGQMFSQPIPIDDAVQETQILNKPLFDYAPQSAAAQGYLATAREIEGVGNKHAA